MPSYKRATNPNVPYREPFGHNGPFPLIACPCCGRTVKRAGASCGPCIDENRGYFLFGPVEGPKPFDPLIDF